LVLEFQLTKTYFGTFSYKAHFRPQISSNAPSCGFAKIGFQGGEIDWNVVKVGVHSSLSNGH